MSEITSLNVDLEGCIPFWFTLIHPSHERYSTQLPF